MVTGLVLILVLIFAELRFEPRASPKPDQHSPTELHSYPEDVAQTEGWMGFSGVALGWSSPVPSFAPQALPFAHAACIAWWFTWLNCNHSAISFLNLIVTSLLHVFS